jgi:5'-methylthioadenosine phosphorylase
MAKAVLGVIGGSGVYDLPLDNAEWRHVASPWGEASDQLRFGAIKGLSVVFLPRHGRGHRLSPSAINYRANIDALKRAGVTDLVSVSACGSFREHLPPGTFVIVDQFIDRTFAREKSFFGAGCVAHVSLGEPVAPLLAKRLAAAAIAIGVPCHEGGTYLCMEGPQFSTRAESLAYRAAGCDVIGMTNWTEARLCREAGATVHVGGTYVCMEGPQFSTRAESELYRSWGMDIIGMTNLQEAKLAREAELCYATIALVTDYDCWHPDHDSVTVDMIIANLVANASTAQTIIAEAVGRMPAARGCACSRALEHAIITRPEHVPDAAKRALAPIIGKYLPIS